MVASVLLSVSPAKQRDVKQVPCQACHLETPWVAHSDAVTHLFRTPIDSPFGASHTVRPDRASGRV